MVAKFANRRNIRASVLALATILAITLVLFSPIFLQAIANMMGQRDWEKLSFIGQTYGAIAALITTISLGAVALSLLLQARTLNAQVEQHARNSYVELVKIGVSDPDLFKSSVFDARGLTRSMMYNGLWISHLRALFLLDYMPENELELEMEAIFDGSSDAQVRWAKGRSSYLAGVKRGREQRWFEIVDNIYTKVLAREEPMADTDKDPSQLEWKKSPYSGAGACVEVAHFENGVLVRDSKNKDGPVLGFTQQEWHVFVEAIRSGELD